MAKQIWRDILTENLLINLRTYDNYSLVFYANDHYNNFVHLYINNSQEVNFLFNSGHRIVNLTLRHENLNSGKSAQVAIIRTPETISMYVNDKNVTIPRGDALLLDYSNTPWENPEMEVLSPHRPPAPPTEYFQINIGGYDSRNLLKTNRDAADLQGFVGCIGGLKIGETLIDLEELVDPDLSHGEAFF